MTEKNTSSSSGIGLGTVLFLIFLVLKLTGTITWNWWWVTSPIWISFGVAFLILLVALLATFIGSRQ